MTAEEELEVCSTSSSSGFLPPERGGSPVWLQLESPDRESAAKIASDTLATRMFTSVARWPCQLVCGHEMAVQARAALAHQVTIVLTNNYS